MKIINLTPHSISFFKESQFLNLASTNPTTWLADAVEGEPIESHESQGVARIATSTIEIDPIINRDVIPAVRTKYGELTGIPEGVKPDDILVVSLPTQSAAHASGHPLAGQMASPYRVVRLRTDTSVILGAIGLSFQ